MSDTQKQVYFFAQGESEGDATMKNTLGGKGANLAEMTNLGIPVPPGFTIATDVCIEFYKQDEKLSSSIREQVEASLKRVEDKIGKKFSDAANPLLVSVRSGARASMPGMMDTILNLGLNDETVEGLAKSSNNERFAWDSYRRFIQMYSNVVLGMNTSLLEMTLEDIKDAKNYEKDNDLTVEDLKQGWFSNLKIPNCSNTTSKTFPMNPTEQLVGSH